MYKNYITHQELHKIYTNFLKKFQQRKHINMKTLQRIWQFISNFNYNPNYTVLHFNILETKYAKKKV
jgi:hypothetical protein